MGPISLPKGRVGTLDCQHRPLEHLSVSGLLKVNFGLSVNYSVVESLFSVLPVSIVWQVLAQTKENFLNIASPLISLRIGQFNVNLPVFVSVFVIILGTPNHTPCYLTLMVMPALTSVYKLRVLFMVNHCKVLIVLDV